MPPKSVLLVFLNTGGGHRSAALAVAEALKSRYKRRVRVEIVDVTIDYFPWPLNKLDAIYARLVRFGGWPWAFTYHLTDGLRRMAMLEAGWWLLTRRSIRSLLNEHPADAIVCCHPLLKAPIARALGTQGCKTSLITLVTDLASGHAAWFRPPDGTCLVATERTQERALGCGLPAEMIHVTGLPVRRCFAEEASRNPRRARRDLGLDEKQPMLLLVSGADGMGPFYALLRAVMDSNAQFQAVAITGRNDRLRAKLTAREWPHPLRVEGFVNNIQDWMRAADLLVTKAGPATIAEALVIGTPMIVSGAVPGQEPANVTYVTETGAAIWAPIPIQAARAVEELLSPDSKTLEQMTRCAEEAGCPSAADRVARVVWQDIRHRM